MTHLGPKALLFVAMHYLDGVSFAPNAAAKIAFHQSLSEAALSRTAGQNDRLPALAADPVRRP
jgi:hypothetical protein